MTSISTPFTKLLNVDKPIVSAPMAFASTPEMAAAVTGSGGFGFIGAGFSASIDLKKMAAAVREKLNVPADKPVPIGFGFIGWILDMTENSPDPRIPAVLEERPAAVWFAFGTDLGNYVAQVREYDSKRDHKTLVFVMVHTVEAALKAANEYKADVIVAQGVEAGGHGSSDAPPLLTLVQTILDALTDGPPVIAAGGISTGKQIASLLTMGATACVCGTRFLFTPECCYSDAMKDIIIKAGHNATVRTLAYDDVGRTNGWPARHDGRAIANKVMDDLAEGCDMEERLKRFDEGKTSGDPSRLVIWAGQGVGLTDQIESASRVVEVLYEEAVAALKFGGSLLQ